jgi:hypothetical protein
MISGTLITGGNSITISEGRLRGNKITFTAGNDVYTGIVDGSKMEGTVTSGRNNNKWNANR